MTVTGPTLASNFRTVVHAGTDSIEPKATATHPAVEGHLWSVWPAVDFDYRGQLDR